MVNDIAIDSNSSSAPTTQWIRLKQNLLENFRSPNPSWMVCMVSGKKGSGKSCFLREIARDLQQESNWIVISQSCKSDMVTGLLEKLKHVSSSQQQLTGTENCDLPLDRDTHSHETSARTGANTQLEDVLTKLTRTGKRVLVVVDDAYSNENIRKFASLLQLYIREDLEIYCIMAGLPENLKAIKDDPAITFLYRSWQVNLS